MGEKKYLPNNRKFLKKEKKEKKAVSKQVSDPGRHKGREVSQPSRQSQVDLIVHVWVPQGSQLHVKTRPFFFIFIFFFIPFLTAPVSPGWLLGGAIG